MIRINGQEYFYFPRNLDITGSMLIEFENTTTHQSYTITTVDKSKNSLYYKAKVEGLPIGEYEYKVRIEDTIVDKGLCVVEDIEPSKKIYNQEVEYAVYGK